MRKWIGWMLLCCLLAAPLAASAQSWEGLHPLWIALTNTQEPLPEDYVPDNLKQASARMVGVHLVTSRAVLLQEEALQALYHMLAAADQAGVELFIRQGYRSWQDEQRRYDTMTATGGVAQKAGESSYQTGLSVTLVDRTRRSATLSADFDQSAEFAWLKANAAAYGFVLRYPQGKENITGWTYEPWHFRYVGTELARELTENNLCLEEFRQDYDQSYAFDLYNVEHVVPAVTAAPMATKAPAVLTEAIQDGENAMAETDEEDEEKDLQDNDDAPAVVEEATATPEPTLAPTPVPTAVPTAEPTAKPTVEPTGVPTLAPTAVPAQSAVQPGAQYLLLASSAEPLPEDYVPAALTAVSAKAKGVHLVTSRAVMLEKTALEALYALLADAEKAGITVYIRQGYRSYDDEARRYDSLISYGEAAQKAGQSSYQTGLSVTLVDADYRSVALDVKFGTTRTGKWLAENAHRYGFVLRYPQGKEAETGWTYEPWHFRYVGLEASRIMTAENLCLEEYLAKYDLTPVLMTAAPQQQGDSLAPVIVATPAPATPTPEPTVNPNIDKFSTGEFGDDGDYEIQLFSSDE